MASSIHRHTKKKNREVIDLLKETIQATAREAFADTCYDIISAHPHFNIGAPYSQDWSHNQWTLDTSSQDHELRGANSSGLESYASVDRGKWRLKLGERNLYFNNPVEYVPLLEEGHSNSAPNGFIEKSLPNFEEHFIKHALRKGL
ncbi:hypothetical protein [Photobacterium leiognathi]|uniref:hypothetical protein n=1 Tax=Photobacterium leiognathi TaxID=553611 RepID=UPI0005B7F9B1|nr:hypothetical protein [Photobacterium leiognathi]